MKIFSLFLFFSESVFSFDFDEESLGSSSDQKIVLKSNVSGKNEPFIIISLKTSLEGDPTKDLDKLKENIADIQIFSRSKISDSKELEADFEQAKQISQHEMNALGDICPFGPSAKESTVVKSLNKTWWKSGIVCGTKWCGGGDISAGYDDLGKFKNLDMCCRAHDHCPDVLKKHSTNNTINLTNESKFSRLSCKCDEDFRMCLKKVKEKPGDLQKLVTLCVGLVYFDCYNAKCYKKDYPIVCCEEFNIWRSKCKATRLDKTKPKKWQWWNTISYVSRKNTCEGGDAHFGDIYKKPQKCKKF